MRASHHGTTREGVTIRHLVDVREVLPRLARWFEQEWEPWYGPDGPGDAVADLTAASERDRLPICLVAVDGQDRPLGTAALKDQSLPSHAHVGPWLAAVLVAPEQRRRGVGTALIAAIEDEARRLGFRRIWTATDTAIGVIERRAWQRVDQAPTLRGDVGVFALDL